MDNYFEYFKKALLEVASTMTGISMTQDLQGFNIEEKMDVTITSTMCLNGDKNIIFTIEVPIKYAVILVSYMIGVDDSEVSEEEIIDGIMEITNMVAGIVKQKMKTNGVDIEISIPTAMVSREAKFVTRKPTEKYVVYLGDELLKICLGVYYF